MDHQEVLTAPEGGTQLSPAPLVFVFWLDGIDVAPRKERVSCDRLAAKLKRRKVQVNAAVFLISFFLLFFEPFVASFILGAGFREFLTAISEE